MADYDVIVVGAGIAGLTCALRLQEEGLQVKVLESTNRVGGRLRSDREDGFIFDHGFHVFQTAYPECRQWLDYEGLRLKAFRSGSYVRARNRFSRIADPWRDPNQFLPALLSSVGSLRDKFLIGKYRKDVVSSDLKQIYYRENISALEALRERGFSRRMIERFFRPFFSGIFLETELKTSRRAMDFIFKMFAEGDAALPERGIAAVPEQLAARLKPDTLSLETEVFEIEPGRVELGRGERMTAASIAVAVPFTVVGTLIKGMVFPRRSWHATTCFYYEAPRSPLSEPMLLLNGEGEGLINSLAVPSDVQPSYAPEGKSLISVSLVGEYSDKEIRPRVEKELQNWFPDQFGDWQHLRTYTISRALPRQYVSDMEPVERIEALEPGFYMCGDHRQTSSIQGAMASGVRTAEALIKERRLTAD